MPTLETMGQSLPEVWAAAVELLRAAGMWGLGGAVLGLVLALAAAPLAALWTRGGWPAGCIWAVLLTVSFGAAGLYAGATYGVARECDRLVDQDLILERSAVTTLLVVAEQRGIDDGDLASILPAISDATKQLGESVGIGALPGASALGLGLPQLVDTVLERVVDLDQLKIEELRELRLGVGSPGAGAKPLSEPSYSVKTLVSSTAPIRHTAVSAIWAGAQPHFVTAAAIAAVPLGLIMIVGAITHLVGRGRRASQSSKRED